MGGSGIEPMTSYLSDKRSTTELTALASLQTFCILPDLRRERESNPRIDVLQTPALPLRHRAELSNYTQKKPPLLKAFSTLTFLMIKKWWGFRSSRLTDRDSAKSTLFAYHSIGICLVVRPNWIK